MGSPTRERAISELREASARRPSPRDLPDDNPKTALGALKPPMLSVVPATVLIQMGQVMALGKKKYGAYNWRKQNVSASTYVDAALRHLVSWWDGEDIDPESGQSHLAHAAASLAVIIDALATGHANDDRPPRGVAAEIIELHRKRAEAAQN